MKIDWILTELVIFARERGGDDQPETLALIKAAERHLDAVQRIRARRARFTFKAECERCEGPSSSGILCWDCLGIAPAAIRHAFRDASGIDGIRLAAEQVRTWIRTSCARDAGCEFRDAGYRAEGTAA
jgi:hypothetical protein